MLTRLTITNYALVEDLDIDLAPGLTVLTGETGAGKSVVIGGLLLALGGRADRELIRHGSDKSTAAAQFDLTPSVAKTLAPILNSTPEKTFILSREVFASGTSRGYIDGRTQPLTTLRDVAALICDLHTQQGQRNLLEADRHLSFLDSYAGLNDDVEKLRQAFVEFTRLEKELADAVANADALREKLELIRFQVDELTRADLRPGEEAELEAEQKKLESVRTLLETGQSVITAVSESDDSILSVLSQLEKLLAQSARIDPDLKPDADLLAETVINLNELTRNLEGYCSRLSDNPERLEEINARLAELYRLRKKYKTDEAGLVDLLKQLNAQTEGTADVDGMINKLKAQVTHARGAYHELALKVSGKRRKAAATLQKKVEKQMADLAIDKARFRIEFLTEEDPRGFDLDGVTVKALPHGLESIEFLISTNPNEPLRPLVKIASGGEISRIMLALLGVIAGKYRFPTIIFDEIDTGIGGVTAVRLAEKLAELAKSHQIITISHLPAVAERADHHLAVSKELQGGRNVITVEKLSGAKIKRELSRMAGAAETA